MRQVRSPRLLSRSQQTPLLSRWRQTPLGRLRLALLLLLTLLTQRAHAQPPRLMLVVADAKGAEVPGLTREVESVLQELGRPTKPSTLSMDELMLAVECTAKSVACLQKIGTKVGVASLLLGTMSQQQGRRTLALRLFDVASGGDRATATVTLAGDASRRAGELRKGLRVLFGLQPPPPAPRATGSLRVSASRPYAEVLIDGQPRGTVPLELRNLPAKRYRVEARLAGYAPWHSVVEVKPGAVTPVEAELQPLTAQATQRKGYLAAIRPTTWLVAGIGAACLVTAVAFGAHMRSQQNSLDELSGDSFAEIARMRDIRDTGQRDALVANILFGVGGAALLTSAVLSYLDYRSERPSGRQATVQLGPTGASFRVSF